MKLFVMATQFEELFGRRGPTVMGKQQDFLILALRARRLSSAERMNRLDFMTFVRLHLWNAMAREQLLVWYLRVLFLTTCS